MLKLFKYLKPYWLLITALVILVFAMVALNLQLPDYMAKIINEGIVNQNTSSVYHNGLIMLLLALGAAACTVVVGFLAARIGTGFARDVRNKIFAQVESFSLVEFNKFSTASLITRSTNDVQQIQMVLVLMLRLVLMAPITAVWAVYKAYALAPSLSWIIALAVVALLGVITTMFTVALPKFKILQKLVDKLNLVTRENLTGLRVIRAFNNEKLEQGKFEQANVELTAANLFVNRLMVVMQPVMMVVFNLTAITIVWVGAKLIGNGSLEVGNMIAFMQYAMQVIMSFLMISIIFIMVPRASVSAGRVSEVIETEPVIKNPKSLEDISGKKGGVVEFKNVSFQYPTADTPVLCDINFTANSGETTAFIGSTGSGKSTLINLIPRFYDVSEGKVLIDGVDVRQMKLEDLYSKIGYVPQKPVLFSGTVESNIKYGAPNSSETDVKKVAEISQAEEFIKNLPEKYQNEIAQGGANVSGGQKQRLSIARALARKPEIYIFDDSFSALDFKTDAALRKALKSETKNKTVLIVAQRIATILSAEKIIVLEEGKIAGVGNHSELMKFCDVYREIALSQLSEEELAKYQIDVDAEKAKIERHESLVAKGGI
ncbi:MAG: ABC transporter ATP-binding protein [Candidatus Berkelbacteria bacterium]|nr:ABC transporter ATP-binding protein [Candidatus Berkelbacteria bacterium]